MHPFPSHPESSDDGYGDVAELPSLSDLVLKLSQEDRPLELADGQNDCVLLSLHHELIREEDRRILHSAP